MHKALFALRKYGNSFVNHPYLLARQGIVVDAVIPAGNDLRRSKWIHRAHLTEADDAAFAEVACSRLATGEYDFLMIGDEPALRAIYASPRAGEIAAMLPLPPESPLAKAIGQKQLFQDFCEEHGIATPRTIRVRSWEETEAACQEIGLPCMLKRVAGSGGKSSVFILRTMEEARTAVSQLPGDPVWMVQEMVQGKTGVAMFVVFDGVVRAWAGLTKKVCLAKGLGPKVISDYLWNPRIGQACEAFAAHGRIRGFTGFDFMERPNGEILAIDPHFGRSPTTPHFALACGVDFGLAIKDSLEGRLSHQSPREFPGLAVKFPECIDFAFQEGLGRLFREAPPWSRNVRYFWGPEGDWGLIAAIGATALKSNVRIKLGALKAALRRKGRLARATGAPTQAAVPLAMMAQVL